MVNRSLLIVDDDRNVISSLRRELRSEDYEIFSANSGTAGLAMIDSLDIGVVLSDQMMPGMDGITFLKELERRKPDVVRTLLTGNGSLENAMAAINDSHIFSYLTKPWSSEGLKGTIAKAFEHYNLVIENKRLQELNEKQNLELKRLNADLEGRIQKRTRQLEAAVREGIVMLATAAEAKDDDTGEHVHRIRGLAFEICTGLGIPQKEADLISFFSMMHDIGKISIPDHILKKAGPLMPEEWEIMQTHCVAGERILGKQPFYRKAREIARSHHELWDGSGYPDHLKGETIPLPARIVTVVDVFDAVTHARPYKKPWPEDRALEEMKVLSGRMFDPGVLDVFLKIQCEKRMCID
ncbi:MAG: HD domain-containing phosphohydrolase [Pseudomonadota bacterium]